MCDLIDEMAPMPEVAAALSEEQKLEELRIEAGRPPDRLQPFEEFAALDLKRKEMEAAVKQVEEELATLEEKLLRIIEETPNLKSVNFRGCCVYLHQQLWASATDIDAVKKNAETSELVKETVNAQTLSSWVRELAEEAKKQGKTLAEPEDCLPDDLKGAIKVSQVFHVRTRGA